MASPYRQSRDTAAADAPVAVAFVGAIVPDTAEFHNPAFSRAGFLFQNNLLRWLTHVGVPPSLVLSQRPYQAYPRGDRWWVPSGRTCLEHGTRVELLPFINVPVLRQMCVGLGVLWRLWRWSRAGGGTARRVVYTYNLSEPAGVFTLLAARLIGAKALVSLNDVNIPGQTVPNSLAFKFDFWLHRQLLPRFDGVVVVADRMAADFAAGVPWIRMEGAVTPELLDRAQTVAPRATRAHFTIGAVGSLDPANGIAEILEAFRLLEDSTFRLVVAGGGPLEPLVRAAAREDPRIDFRGFIPFERVLEVYREVDVLVNMRITRRINTAYFFPSKALEYLASGVPMISTCPAHTRQEFADVAFLIDDETPDALARAILRVAALSPSERSAMASKALQFMRDKKAWPVQARRIADFVVGVATGQTQASERS